MFSASNRCKHYGKAGDYVRMLSENRKWQNHLIVFPPDSWFHELSETRPSRNFLIETKRCGKPFTLIDNQMGKHNVCISFLARLRSMAFMNFEQQHVATSFQTPVRFPSYFLLKLLVVFKQSQPSTWRFFSMAHKTNRYNKHWRILFSFIYAVLHQLNWRLGKELRLSMESFIIRCKVPATLSQCYVSCV